MSLRAIGSSTLSFGLVSIPVKLYSATESSTQLSFNLLHKECGSRLKQQYTCPKDGKLVPREEMVKGYEFAKDQYVTFTAEELKALEETSTQTIDIVEFVPGDKIDSIYFDKPYYLGADKGGDKSYRLLVQAMAESGRVALGRYAARGKQYLVMLRPTSDGRLVMQQLHYADEVRASKEVPIADGEVRADELKLALQLIDQIAHETFSPSVYEDDVKKRTLEQIERKIQGHEIAVSPEAPRAEIIDLMAALKASLEQKAAATERKPPKRAEAADKPAQKSKAKS